MTQRSGSEPREGEEHEGLGNRKPPVSTRFAKGQSGNLRGRPKGRHKDAPYEAVLGQKVTIRETGTERRVTGAQAFLLQLAKRGLEGDGVAGRATMQAIEVSNATRPAGDNIITHIVLAGVSSGSVNTALEPLRMGRILDRSRVTARVLLEPWIVQAAFARLADRRLTPAEQHTVVKATRTPQKVKWPEWWSENG